jgi:uncharacterized protein YjbJ (UPF0337 family)
LVQIGAMEHPVGRAIALDRRRAEIEELPALPGAPEADLLALRLDRDAAERILEPERDQNAGPVGADLDAGATSRSAGACSKTATSKPRRSSASAAARPPIPAPTMRMRGAPVRTPLSRLVASRSYSRNRQVRIRPHAKLERKWNIRHPACDRGFRRSDGTDAPPGLLSKYVRHGGSWMNWDTIGGNWKQFVGKAKEKWGKLTDDDWTMIEGKRDQLIGRVQERYGVARDVAERQVAEFERDYERV